MKYLGVTYHDINGKAFRYIPRFLLPTCLVGIFLIITGSIPRLFIFQKLSEPIINLVYFCVWGRQTRIFYKTLKLRYLENKIRGMNCQTVKKSDHNCHHFAFAVVMSMIGVGFLSIISCIVVGGCFFFIMTAFRYDPCLFHNLYGTPYYAPLLTTK